MKVLDIIFALIAGRIIGFLIGDFLQEWGIHLGFYYVVILWILLPFLALCFLWLAALAGRKLLFVFQGAKHFLVGTVAMVFDLKFFELLVWIFSFFLVLNPLIAKGVSFIFSTLIKYWGNKYWAFARHERENIVQEVMQFFLITLLGLIIDVSAFYYFSVVVGPQFDLSAAFWLKISVILAGATAALWNFLGYKFFVFKK